jgi:hypothetical protein
VWLSVSLLLVGWWVRAARRGHAKMEWSALVALALLLVLLFPVISMTDDLVAMTAPAETEHMLRRGETLLAHVASVGVLDAVALAAMLFISIAFFGASFSRIRPRTFIVTLLAGFVRTCGVRPPPATAPAA